MGYNNAPLRILHIASGDLWAGAEAVVYQLVKSLSQRSELKVFLITLNHGRLEELCSSAGVDTFVIDEKQNNFVSIALKAARIIRKIRPDVIHSHRYKENLIAAIAGSLGGRPKLVSTQHGLTELKTQNFRERFIGYITKSCRNLTFSAIVGVSEDVAWDLKNGSRILSKKIYRIYNGIDIEPHSECNGFPRQDPITIGSAGRLFPVKDYPMMVDIAHEVCKKANNVRFVIAGDGPERKLIKQKIDNYGLESRFTMLGHIQDMNTFYQTIDIYINTSVHEGIPMTILEAMGYKKPVVGFLVGGLKEIITQGVEGYLVSKRDPSIFAKALLELVENSGKLNIFGQNARLKIGQRFSSQRMTNGYLGIYRGNVNGRIFKPPSLPDRY